MNTQKKRVLKVIKKHLLMIDVLIQFATTTDELDTLTKAHIEAKELLNSLNGFEGVAG